MVVKKTVKKAPSKLATKTAVKQPTVTVETKKISNSESCCWTNFSCWSLKNVFITILLIVNTILLSVVLINQTKMEVLRTGWKENYELLKQVFETEWYKTQQKQQLEQALQLLSQPQQMMPSAEEMQITPEQMEWQAENL